MGRPRSPLIPYIAPTEEERDLGSYLRCEGECGREWPLRLCSPSIRRCVNCARDYWKAEREARRGHHWRTYGLTTKDLRALLIKQRGRCAICPDKEIHLSAEPRAQLDHDHKTGAPRGLLCRSCNLALGFLEDDEERVLNAAKYLRERKSTKPYRRPRRLNHLARVSVRSKKPHHFISRSGEKINLTDPAVAQRLLYDDELRADVDAYVSSVASKRKEKKPTGRGPRNPTVRTAEPLFLRSDNKTKAKTVPPPEQKSMVIGVGMVDALLRSRGLLVEDDSSTVIDVEPIDDD